MTFNLLRDGRKATIQAFMGKPGSRVDLSVSNSADVTFQPDLAGHVRLYAIETNAKINFAAHNGDYTFDSTSEPPLNAGTQELFILDGTRRDRVTMRAVSSAATVTIFEVDDD